MKPGAGGTLIENPGCEVCFKHTSVGVTSSALAPMSYAICKQCLHNGAEPKWIVEHTIQDCGGVHCISPDVLDGTTYFENDQYIKMRDFK